MKRFVWLVGLMALSSPARARDYSFVYRGHDIHIEAARHCRSLSCVSVLVGDRHKRRDRDDDELRDGAPSAPVPVQAQPVVAPMQAVRAPIAPPSVMVQPVAQPVRAPMQQVQPAPMPAPALASAPPAPSPAVAVQAPPAPLPPPPAKVEQPKPQQPARVEEAESDPDSPLGDWQTDGKANLVRIETCGASLCGFVLDAATRTKGESVLINMKPKNDTEWTGNVYSRASGNSYYGRMTLKDGKTLRVEACALGSFFCSGNNWTRIEQKPASLDDLISSHETAPRVRS
ncbi:MAG TPA: DUF2147 domain-containing protein [Rhizomicrobium sp.]